MREPTIKEIALFLEIDEGLINEAINSLNPIKSLDETINEDETFSYYEVIPDEDYDLDNKIMLEESLKGLSDSEKRLLELRYYKDRTQTEVAEIFNTSQAGISREEKKILVKLRNSLSA